MAKRDIKGSAETNIRQGQRIRRLQEDVEELQQQIQELYIELDKLNSRLLLSWLLTALIVVLLWWVVA